MESYVESRTISFLPPSGAVEPAQSVAGWSWRGAALLLCMREGCRRYFSTRGGWGWGEGGRQSPDADGGQKNKNPPQNKSPEFIFLVGCRLTDGGQPTVFSFFLSTASLKIQTMMMMLLRLQESREKIRWRDRLRVCVTVASLSPLVRGGQPDAYHCRQGSIRTSLASHWARQKSGQRLHHQIWRCLFFPSSSRQNRLMVTCSLRHVCDVFAERVLSARLSRYGVDGHAQLIGAQTTTKKWTCYSK